MKDMKKQSKQLIFLAFSTGLVYYFFVYLPQNEKEEQERQRQAREVAQQRELELQQAEQRREQNQQQQEVERLKKLENIKKKKLHWRRERTLKSWTDNWLARKKESFENVLAELGGEENINIFDVAAEYTIHFPPSLWSSLTDEQKSLAKSKGHGELELDEETKNFHFNDLVTEWEEKVFINPIRGDPNPITKKDNNALFYGTGGTGKTSLVRRVAYNSDVYPLIEIKGPSLTPRKSDYNNGVDPLNKFIFTLCDIENTLEDDFHFQRQVNGEIRYILFVDECDNVCSNTALPTEYTKLIFLKTCMEGINKSEQSQNLWIFATNYIDLIDKPVYRPGRLSNPLDFSWTLGDFKHYSDEAGIIDQFPSHWVRTNTLNEEDNKWVNRFNKNSFENEFLTFWHKFIRNAETLNELVEEKEFDNKTGKEITKKKGIQLGEFFEFFWKLFDSKQLHNFDGKWEKPSEPKVEELMPKITEAIDNRISELNLRLVQITEEINHQTATFITTFNKNATDIANAVKEVARK